MDPTAAKPTNFVSVRKQKDVLRRTVSFISDIEKDITQAIESSLSFAGSGELIRIGAADLRHIIQSKKVEDVEACLKNILLGSLVGIEKKSGIASLIACLTCVRTVQQQISKHHLGLQLAPPAIDDVLCSLSLRSECIGVDTIGETIGTYLGDPLVTSMVMQAHRLAGHAGQIFVDKEFAAATCIELMSGYTFPYGIQPEFAAATKTTLWKASGVKCIIIDGIIEKVSEIHHVLQYFFEEKRPGVIVCRGYSEEVLGTLIANYNRQTLNVIPVTVPYDLEGMNALVDIATTCRSDVVSSLKGELISSIDVTEVPIIEKITLSNKLIISNPSAGDNVRNHLSHILKQKDAAGAQDKKDLFDKRMKPLSSVCVHIKIDSHQKNRGLCFSRIDHGIKIFREMAAYGAIKLDGISENSFEKSLVGTCKLFSGNGYQYLPAYSFILGYKAGEEMANSILSSMVYLVLDK